MKDDLRRLVEAAAKAREAAHAPYSRFPVGAALRGRSGTIYLGVNVENASYGLTVCAERTAVVRAVADGERSFDAIAVVADTTDVVTPCGACRQFLAEFAGPDLVVVLANVAGKTEATTLGALLPRAFSAQNSKRPGGAA